MTTVLTPDNLASRRRYIARMSRFNGIEVKGVDNPCDPRMHTS